MDSFPLALSHFFSNKSTNQRLDHDVLEGNMNSYPFLTLQNVFICLDLKFGSMLDGLVLENAV